MIEITKLKSVLQAYHDTLGEKRGWLDAHLSASSPTQFGLQIILALLACEKKQQGLGVQFAAELAEVPYFPSSSDRKRWFDGFEQLMQKLAELIALKAICSVEWSIPFEIKIEPTNSTTGKRPDFVVEEGGHFWLFEVKCPAFVAFKKKRKTNLYQMPVRLSLHGLFKGDPGGLTLPRDNVVKDFLSSAESKFSSFSTNQTGILIIAWDAHVYEAVSVLKHPEAGLLTNKSWLKSGKEIISFSSVDHVIVVNKLDDLISGAQEQLGPFNENPFSLDRENGLPASWCPNDEKAVLDRRVAAAFDAWHYDGTGVAADYALTDCVMWINPHEIAQRRRRNRRRAPYLVSGSAFPYL